jgi:hypothetical protein
MAEQKEKARTMRVIEIGDGDFYSQLQEAFERALSLSFKHRIKMKVKTSITVHKPEPIRVGSKEVMTGKITFEVQEPVLKKVSMEYQTELDENGMVIAQGNDAMDFINEDMFEGTEYAKVTNFQKKESVNG